MSRNFSAGFIRHTTESGDLEQIQNNLENRFRDLEACDIIQGRLITEISLASGDNDIEHKLGRTARGFIITRFREAHANVYEKISTNSSLDRVLKLNSSGATTVDIWVF
jgi:hypothetical protein|tara:strand:+ start:27 stop:353 length:327 start_codon:yes stop_codon:yes gene_type:complete